MDLVLGDLFDDTGAHIGFPQVVLVRVRWLLPLAILELRDLLVDAHLLAHNALNVNLLWLVVIFY